MIREPESILEETERLEIRQLKQTDFDVWLDGFENRLTKQSTYDDEKPDMSEFTQGQFNQIVEKINRMAVNDEAYVFGVFRKSDQKHLGKVEFSTILRGEFQWAVLGYTIHNQHWQQGYGKEAVNAGMKIAFESLGYHRVEAHINVDNKPSIKLAEVIGMEYECLRKNFILEDGEWTDNLIYYMNIK